MATDTVLEELVINDLTHPINPDDLPTTKEPNQLYLDDDTSLEKVVHDATLSGDGTEDSPLSVVGGGGASGLPDQTGHTGFLQTNGTEASWSDKEPLVNNGTGSGSIGISGTASARRSIAIGNNSSATGEESIAIGNGAKASASSSICIGGGIPVASAHTVFLNVSGALSPSGIKKADHLVFANTKGTYSVIQADGTIPSERLASDGSAGQVLSKTDTGMAWVNAGGGASGSDNNGLEGDYATTYGIADETTSGLPYIKAVGSRIVVFPAQLQVDMPGVPGLTTLTSNIEYEVQNTNNPQLFLLDTPINGSRIIESTDVFFSETEPDNGTSTFAVWWDGSGVFKLKSNDTGNVWREANAVRIAKTVFTGTSLTRLCFTGCRLLNKQEFATKQQLSTGLLGKATKSTDFMTAVTSTNKGATKAEIDDINNSISTINTNIGSINTNIDSLYEELGEKLDTTVAASTYVTNTDAVHKAGDETITGQKTLTSNLILGNMASDAVSSRSVMFKTAGGQTMAMLDYLNGPSGGELRLFVYGKQTGSAVLKIGEYNSNGTPTGTFYMQGITPPPESQGPQIATTEWVKGHGVLVASQMPTSENNWTWYRKYSDGWVEQGAYLFGIEPSETKTFTFPVPYTNIHTYYILSTATNTTVWKGGDLRNTTSCQIGNIGTVIAYTDVYTCGVAA